MHQEVDDAVGVSPLIIIPRHNLEEALLTLQVVLESGLGVIDGGVHVAHEVHGHQLLIGEGEDALHVALRGLLEQTVDLLDGGVLLCGEGEVNDGDIRRGHAEGHARELSLGAGQNLSDCLGGSGRGWDNVTSRRATSTPILSRHAIHGLLSGGVGMDGGHQALLDSHALLQEDVADWGQAVRGAGRVGDHVMLGLVVFRVVHAADLRNITSGRLTHLQPTTDKARITMK